MKESIAAGLAVTGAPCLGSQAQTLYQTDITNIPVTRSSWPAYMSIAPEPSSFTRQRIVFLRLPASRPCAASSTAGNFSKLVSAFWQNGLIQAKVPQVQLASLIFAGSQLRS